MDNSAKYNPNTIIALVLSLLSAVFAALGGAVLGSAVLLIIAGVLQAFAICKTKNALWLFSLPLSYVLALILSRNAMLSLTVFLSVPVLLALWYCAKKKKALSATVLVLSFAIAASIAVLFTVWTVKAYGEDIAGSYKLYLADLKEYWGLITDYMGQYVNDDGVRVFSEETVSMLSEFMTMTSPAIAVVTVEILAYGAAKLFRLMTIILRAEELLPSAWRVKVLLPTSILCFLSFMIMTFSPAGSICYYVCTNLVLMLVPMAAISGFHNIFGPNGTFRRAKTTFQKVTLIISLVIFAYTGPVFFGVALTCWEAYTVICDAVFKKLSQKSPNDSGDDDFTN